MISTKIMKHYLVFNFVALKEIYVAVLIVYDLKTNRTAWNFGVVNFQLYIVQNAIHKNLIFACRNFSREKSLLQQFAEQATPRHGWAISVSAWI